VREEHAVSLRDVRDHWYAEQTDPYTKRLWMGRHA
jgi:hypothetical protein